MAMAYNKRYRLELKVASLHLRSHCIHQEPTLADHIQTSARRFRHYLKAD